MTVTDTAGALGVSCVLADLTSVQPETTMSRSDQAISIVYHDRLVRLSCVIAVFPLPLSWHVRFLRANANTPGPMRVNPRQPSIAWGFREVMFRLSRHSPFIDLPRNCK
jgi:hypothetical protein